MHSRLNDPPSADEFEVSVFGPGRGESCVIHLGANEWMVIDSCRDQRSRTREVAPLKYLSDMGVDISQQVKLVVATHAHDDHIAGISEVFEASESAYFVYPIALSREEFAVLVGIDAEATRDLKKRNYGEYSRVRDLIEDRKLETGRSRGMYAIEGRELYASADPGRAPVKVRALSPSDLATEITLAKLLDYLPSVEDQVVPLVVDPNELSVDI